MKLQWIDWLIVSGLILLGVIHKLWGSQTGAR